MTANSGFDDVDLPPETEEEVYRNLVRALRRKQGFGLFFVQCSPDRQTWLMEKLKTDLPQKRMQRLELDRDSETMYDKVEVLWKQQPFDILFVQRLEQSLYKYEDTKRLAGWSSAESYSYSWKGVPPIFNHLNQQRERFRDNFDCCFVFFVRSFVIKYFVQRAPDFFDWRSGMFEFPMDADLIAQECNGILLRDFDEYSSLTQAEQTQKVLEIQTYLDKLENKLETPEQQAQLYLKRGLIFTASQDHKAAIASYDQALKYKPDDHFVWYCRGIALSKLERYEEAIASYDQALKFKPDYGEAWDDRGTALDKLGRYEEAIVNYNNALQIEPDDYNSAVSRSISLIYLNRYEEAISSYDSIFTFVPHDGDSLYFRGLLLKLGSHKEWRQVTLRELKKITQAINTATQELTPLMAERAKQPDLVEEKLQQLKGFLLSLINQAEAIKQISQTELLAKLADAIDCFDQAIKNQPNYSEAYYSKAECYGLQGQVELAIATLKQAIALSPKYREKAKTDADFDAIREDDRFQALTRD
ncbi:tetratricopeptide repeat protein [Phormidesmis priestleyi]